jgi:hypothetical protein
MLISRQISRISATACVLVLVFSSTLIAFAASLIQISADPFTNERPGLDAALHFVSRRYPRGLATGSPGPFAQAFD